MFRSIFTVTTFFQLLVRYPILSADRYPKSWATNVFIRQWLENKKKEMKKAVEKAKKDGREPIESMPEPPAVADLPVPSAPIPLGKLPPLDNLIRMFGKWDHAAVAAYHDGIKMEDESDGKGGDDDAEGKGSDEDEGGESQDDDGDGEETLTQTAGAGSSKLTA